MATILAITTNNENVVKFGEILVRCWPQKHTVPMADVIAALGIAGIDPAYARSLGAPDAFKRAVKAAVAKRAAAASATDPNEDVILREVPSADADQLCYQFTHEFRLHSGTAMGYTCEATVCLSRATGIVTSSDATLAAEIQAAIPHFQGTKTFSDLNRLIENVMVRELGRYSFTRLADGVLYVPDMTISGRSVLALADRLEDFAKLLGGWFVRTVDRRIVPIAVAPAPSASPSGAPSVPSAPYVPVPAPIPSTLPPTGDPVADSYGTSVVGRLSDLEEKVADYLTKSYKHMKRAESREKELRDELAAAMTEIETIGREGYLGVMWEKFFDYLAGIQFLLDNPTVNTGVVTTPITVVPSVPVSAPSVDAALIIFPVDEESMPGLPVELECGDCTSEPSRLTVDKPGAFASYTFSALV